MNKRMERTFCLALLVFSVAVRASLSAGFDPGVFSRLQALWDKPAAAESVSAEPLVWTVDLLPPEPVTLAAPAPQNVVRMEATPVLVFEPSEADAISITGTCTRAVDRQALLTRPSALTVPRNDDPQVLIVHTHSSEAYTPEPGWEYEASDELRTEDAAHSVIRVGDWVAELLRDAGISVLHDTALNDYPTYNGAYARMQTTIEQYLSDYPSIQMVLDIHRDAASAPDGSPVAHTVMLDGQDCARLMLVVGTDEGGLSHPDWEENLANALKLQALLNRSAPGLCRSLDLRTERFNQHETPGSVLVEFGSTGNTLRQALNSADYLAAALITFLQSEK